jgi:undecaprenyl-diphosphatase
VNTILAALNRFDSELYVILNMKLNIPLLSQLMVIFSSEAFGILLFLATFVYLFLKLRSKKILAVLVLALSALVSADAISTRVLKPFFERTRPCYQIDKNRVLVASCGSEYGFPSNHAANAMAVATVIGLAIPSLAATGVAFACLIGFSRVIVGVHYPFDVLAGLFLGLVVGLCFHLFLVTRAKYSKRI